MKPDRFRAAMVAEQPEPVRRYLTHALRDGAMLGDAVEISMIGSIRVGPWLSFTAHQQFRGHEFTWEAHAGIGRVRPLHVVDQYQHGHGSTEGRVFGRVRFLHAADDNTTRAAAARGAAESMWVPASLLPGSGVDWRVEADDHIVATISVPPECPDVHLQIDKHGAIRRFWLDRWGNVGQDDYGYIPFGGTVHGDADFGDVVIPASLEVGWWFGTPRYRPFFRATVTAAVSSGDR
jgi:hypothetical protein